MAGLPLTGSSDRFVVIDVETTGLSPWRGHRIIEVGAVAVEAGKLAGEFHRLICTGRSVPPSAMGVHGLSDALLQGQPPPEAVYPELRRFLAGSPLVAHNVRFDMGFLRCEFARLGIALPNRGYCTLRLCRRRLPRLPDHRLETVARHLLGDLDPDVRLHRALADARLTAQVWMALQTGQANTSVREQP